MIRACAPRRGRCVLTLLAAIFMVAPQTTGSAQEAGIPAPAFCFAPGTDQSVVDATRERALWTSDASSVSPERFQKYEYTDGDRWRTTATDGSGLSQGDPTTLTWSIVPDGTSITPALGGESAAGSSLRAFLNGIYPNEAAWVAEFQKVFDRWGALTGITYIYVEDDGAPLPTSPGQLGVRGDVRISGHGIDGNWGVLAYNYFPSTGDMVIDVPDSYYENTSSASIRLRNVVAHEHGHGLGLEHSCPINQTKLMEPFVTLAFDGPQHDDILATNRAYGDRYEHDDTAGSAAALGEVTTITLRDLSIDDSGDADYFSFTAAAGQTVSATLTPVGSTYLSGPQNSNGSCSAGESFDSLRIHDLSLQLLASNGSTVLEAADEHGVGVAEELVDVPLGGAPGTFYARITGDATSLPQLYELTISFSGSQSQPPEGDVFTDGFESGNCSDWTEMTP